MNNSLRMDKKQILWLALIRIYRSFKKRYQFDLIIPKIYFSDVEIIVTTPINLLKFHHDYWNKKDQKL